MWWIKGLPLFHSQTAYLVSMIGKRCCALITLIAITNSCKLFFLHSMFLKKISKINNEIESKRSLTSFSLVMVIQRLTYIQVQYYNKIIIIICITKLNTCLSSNIENWIEKINNPSSSYFSSVMVIPRLTSIEIRWNQLSYRNDQLKIVLENSFHRREVTCDGHLGHKLVSYINPGIDYNLTIFKIHHEETILMSDSVRLSTTSECFEIYIWWVL